MTFAHTGGARNGQSPPSDSRLKPRASGEFIRRRRRNLRLPRSGCLAALLALSLSGCRATCGAQPLVQPVPQPAGPLQYVRADTGLPQTRMWKSHIAFGDVNGDGFPDLGAVTRLADGPWIFAGDGKGNWMPAAEGLPRESFCGGGMAFGDINRDGATDVAIACHCNGISVYWGDGHGRWANVPGPPKIRSEDIALGDFDRDGCLDLALATSEEGIHALKGDCKGGFSDSSDGLPREEWGNSVVMADMDGDGNLDLVAAYSAGPRVWLGDGTGTWRDASLGLPAPSAHGFYWGLAVGDVNGDGKLDVATGAAVPGAEVFVQTVEPNGPGWRSASEGILTLTAAGVALGDLNGDAHLDLVVAGKTDTKKVGGTYGLFPFLGDGAGHWRLVEDSGLPATGRERTWGVALADVDRDGVLDVGAAYGDVMSRGSGPDSKPQRGLFGALEVWSGRRPRRPPA